MDPSRRAPSAEHLLTGADLTRRPDVGRSELVRGRVVLKSPSFLNHGRVELNIAHELISFVRPRKLGQVVVGEVGVFTARGPDTVRGADVAYISNERLAQSSPGHGFLEVAPELVVEILTQSERLKEVLPKIAEYFSIGVKLVWVAEIAGRRVSVYRSLEQVQVHERDDLITGEDVLPGFSIRVGDLFQ